MHITDDMDDALRKWRKEVYCPPCGASVWNDYATAAHRPFILDVFADEFEEERGETGIYRYPGPALLTARKLTERASTLSHDLAIDYDEALALVKASSSDTAIRLIVRCCVAAHQGLEVGVSILKGAVV